MYILNNIIHTVNIDCHKENYAKEMHWIYLYVWNKSLISKSVNLSLLCYFCFRILSAYNTYESRININFLWIENKHLIYCFYMKCCMCLKTMAVWVFHTWCWTAKRGIYFFVIRRILSEIFDHLCILQKEAQEAYIRN